MESRCTFSLRICLHHQHRDAWSSRELEVLCSQTNSMDPQSKYYGFNDVGLHATRRLGALSSLPAIEQAGPPRSRAAYFSPREMSRCSVERYFWAVPRQDHSDVQFITTVASRTRLGEKLSFKQQVASVLVTAQSVTVSSLRSQGHPPTWRPLGVFIARRGAAHGGHLVDASCTGSRSADSVPEVATRLGPTRVRHKARRAGPAADAPKGRHSRLPMALPSVADSFNEE